MANQAGSCTWWGVGRLRKIDPIDPRSWEFSGFSQNGEDGIIDYLLAHLETQSRYFIEIGASNGLENNTSWLALVHRYSGLMVEGDPVLSKQCRQTFASLNWGLQIIGMRVTHSNADEVLSLSLNDKPDVLSLDIDGIDYYVMERILELNIRPKIIVVEYNSALGPEASVTVQYKDDFNIAKEHPTRLYYGVSISGWRQLFSRRGYQFVTVEQNGVNGFFIDPKEFPGNFIQEVRGITFRENFAQMCRWRSNWRAQYEMIKDCSFHEIKS